MWPFTVCSYLGRYFLTRYNIRPEKVAKKFCFVASVHVEIGGMKHAWWSKIARFYFGEHSYTEFVENCSRIGDGFIYFYDHSYTEFAENCSRIGDGFIFLSVISFSFISNINSFVSGSLSPLIINIFVFLSIIMTSFSSKNPNIRYHRIFQSTLTHVSNEGKYELFLLPLVYIRWVIDLLLWILWFLQLVILLQSGYYTFWYRSLLISLAWNFMLFLNPLPFS